MERADEESMIVILACYMPPLDYFIFFIFQFKHFELQFELSLRFKSSHFKYFELPNLYLPVHNIFRTVLPGEIMKLP